MESNLSLYNAFLAVAKSGNISHAARELYSSQPAISKAISKLEENLDTKLFIRNSRGVSLTEEGEVLYQYINSAFSDITAGEERIKKINTMGIGTLRLGVSSTLCKYIMLNYLKNFIKENPHITISISCQSTNDTLKMLEEGTIDVGLIGKPCGKDNIVFTPLEEIEDIFVASRAYIENLKIRGLKGNIFKESTLMLLDKNNMTRQYIDDYLVYNNISTDELIEVSNMELLIEFAKIGMGISCVIKEFVKTELAEKTLIQLPLDIPIHKRWIGFAYNSSINQSKSSSKFITFYHNNSYPR
ncbi:LysR family transcriptional regulator [Acetitomaculum ruminis]|nr:LysR family transcriptional regulator [Acetitomaculum ruminis]